MSEAGQIIAFLERRLADAELYYEVYDYHEAMHDAETLPAVIQELKNKEYLKDYSAIWEVDPDDLEAFKEEMAELNQ